MKYSFDEVEELANILEDEARGLPIDRTACRDLALFLGSVYPEIGASMSLISKRMSAPSDGEAPDSAPLRSPCRP